MLELKYRRCIITLALLLFILSKCTHCELCDHDKLNYTIHQSEYDDERPKLRNLQSGDSFAPIRITADYTFLNSMGNDTLKTHIINQVKASIQYLQEILKVVPIAGNNFFPSGDNTCGSDYTVPAADQTNGIPDSDLHLYVRYEYASSQSFVANALACVATSGLQRPKFGRVNYNTYYMRNLDCSDPEEFKNFVQTTVHEITHVLGFSSGLYSLWKDRYNGFATYTSLTQQATIRGVLTKYLTSPTITEVAKKHFGCGSMVGMQLENQGGDGSLGSHWEVMHIYGEYMNAQVIPTNAIFSNFTLALLYDTGWYNVDFSLAEYIAWGENNGCDFLDTGCNSTLRSYEEFNLNGVNNCSFDRQGFGYPYQHSFGDYCSLTQPYSNAHCTASTTYYTLPPIKPNKLSVNSRCFESTYIQSAPSSYSSGSTTGCYEYTCKNNNQEVDILLVDQPVTCTTGGQVISTSVASGGITYSGILKCPIDIPNFCQMTPLCPNHCSLNGICVKGQCHCINGYAGSSCSILCNQVVDGSTCTANCPSQQYPNPYNKQCTQCNEASSNYAACSVACTAPNCELCQPGSGTQCMKCLESSSFYLVGDTANCDACNLASGKYVTTDTYKRCKNCMSDCLLCSTGSTCTQCNEANSKYLLGNTQTCGACDTANGNYINNDPYKKCVACPQNYCKICTASTGATCIQCKEENGYYLIDETGTCGTCATTNGYYITNDSYKKCKACSAHCLECTSPTSCTKCDQNNQYYILPNGLCGGCSTNSGYYISNDANKKCLQCTQQNCLECTPGTGQYCIKCDPSTTTYVYLSTGLCQPCNTSAGEYITTDQIRCLKCTQANCMQCTPGTSAQCLLCNETDNFFVLENNQCGACDSDLCLACTIKYNQCSTCNTTQHRVSTPVGGACPCEGGYFQTDSKKCQKCHYSCATCANSFSCSTCQSDGTTHRKATPLTNGFCQCDTNYKDDGVNMNCVYSQCYFACSSCSIEQNQFGCSSCNEANFRVLNGSNECLCKQGYYDNFVTEKCSQCNSTCKTCTTWLACESCHETTQFRIKNPGQTHCTCKIGYYEDSSDVCGKCHHSCLTCLGLSACSTCRQDSSYNRILTPDPTSGLCACQNGYNEDAPNSVQCSKKQEEEKFTPAMKTAAIATGAAVPGVAVLGIVIKKLFFKRISSKVVPTKSMKIPGQGGQNMNKNLGNNPKNLSQKIKRQPLNQSQINDTSYDLVP